MDDVLLMDCLKGLENLMDTRRDKLLVQGPAPGEVLIVAHGPPLAKFLLNHVNSDILCRDVEIERQLRHRIPHDYLLAVESSFARLRQRMVGLVVGVDNSLESTCASSLIDHFESITNLVAPEWLNNFVCQSEVDIAGIVECLLLGIGRRTLSHLNFQNTAVSIYLLN